MLRTNHQALTTLHSSKGNSRAGLRVARWSARLLEFNYDAEYRPGPLNSVADCLSRMPLPNTDHIYAETIETVALVSFASSAISKGDFQTACNNCPVLTKLRTYQQTGWPKSKKDVNLHVQPYFPIRHELAVVEGCIFRYTSSFGT